jgi:hypothetical protein
MSARTMPRPQELSHDQRNDLQIWTAWKQRPAVWQAVIEGLTGDEIDMLLLKMARAGVPAADIAAMAVQAK